MSDLAEPVYRRTVRMLESGRVAWTRYADLLEAQRAALLAGDLAALAALAQQATSLTDRMEQDTRLSADLGPALAQAHGPRATRVRELLAGVTRAARAAQADLAGCSALAGERRSRIRRALDAETSAAPGGSVHPPAALDATG